MVIVNIIIGITSITSATKGGGRSGDLLSQVGSGDVTSQVAHCKDNVGEFSTPPTPTTQALFMTNFHLCFRATVHLSERLHQVRLFNFLYY